MSTDLSNTGSFSYRPDQIANPYNFSFNTASQGNRLWLLETWASDSGLLVQPGGIRRPSAGPGAAIRA